MRGSQHVGSKLLWGHNILRGHNMLLVTIYYEHLIPVIYNFNSFMWMAYLCQCNYNLQSKIYIYISGYVGEYRQTFFFCIFCVLKLIFLPSTSALQYITKPDLIKIILIIPKILLLIISSSYPTQSSVISLSTYQTQSSECFPAYLHCLVSLSSGQ